MRLGFFTAFVLFLSPHAFSAPELSDRIQITELNGPRSVKVIRAAGAREQFLEPGEMLFVGDELQTAKGQIVSLMAYDGAKWKIAPDTRFKVEARKAEKQTFYSWTFQIFRGAMWGQVPHNEETKDAMKLRVHTKTAALGIRGTEYLMEGDDKRGAIDVLEGVVWFGKSKDFAPGSYREVSAGQHAEIGADGKVEVTKSKGDNAALAGLYGLVPEANGKNEKNRKKSGSAEDCRGHGKGWKTGDGSKQGECTD